MTQISTFSLIKMIFGRSFLLTGKSFLLTVGLCCLRSVGLVFFTYGRNSVWSSLLTVEIGLVFFAYGSPLAGNWVWSFLLTVPPVREIGFGLFCLRFPHRK